MKTISSFCLNVISVAVTLRFLFMWLLAMSIVFSCARKGGEDKSIAAAGITLCGTVQFSDGCGEKTDSLISYGLALVHHMTYEEAEKVFDQVIEADPECFWGYWGKAMTFIHPVWPDDLSEEHLKLGIELSSRALELSSNEKEAAYGGALAAYYENGLERTKRERLQSFENEWEKAYSKYPEDLEVKSFYALVLISTADPADKTYKNQLKAGKMAEEVLQVIPNHPGGFHYTIHAYDYPELADKAIAAAEKYSDIAPDVPHALHMPTHIFTRLGAWEQSISWNTRSANAALKQPIGGTVSGHYFHAADYLVYAYLQGLEDNKAKQILEDVKNVQGPYQEVPATAYSLAAVEGRYALERQEWQKAASLKQLTSVFAGWDKFPEYEALTHFAIGLGSARSGLANKAEEAVKNLEELKLKVGNPYWSQQIEVQKTIVKTWLAFTKKKESEALELMTIAANMENATNKHPITPGELLPASELLGDMLLELNKPDEALSQYEIALKRSPRRFNSLYGAARAAELSGNDSKAKMYYEELVEVSSNAEISSSRRKQTLAYLGSVAEGV